MQRDSRMLPRSSSGAEAVKASSVLHPSMIQYTIQLSFIPCELADPICTVLHTELLRCCLPIMPEADCPGLSPYPAGGVNTDVDCQVLRRVDHLWYPTCGPQTPIMSVYGRRCLQPGCRGSVEFEVCTLRPVMHYPILIDTYSILSCNYHRSTHLRKRKLWSMAHLLSWPGHDAANVHPNVFTCLLSPKLHVDLVPQIIHFMSKTGLQKTRKRRRYLSVAPGSA